MTERLPRTTHPGDSGSLFTGRSEYVSQVELDEAADVFVKAMGWRNQDRLSENLRNVLTACDAMKALNRALVANFNIYRQDQIRKENEHAMRDEIAKQLAFAEQQAARIPKLRAMLESKV